MAFKIPSALRLQDLKLLASKCGVALSGTKPLLLKRLHDEITCTPHAPPKTRVLSIDMGIRNLAFCILDIPPKVFINAEPVSSTSDAPIDVVAAEELPQIQAWQRLSVST